MSHFRGFGFITFDDPGSVDKVLAQGTHELDGKKVSIKIYCLLSSEKREKYENEKKSRRK